MKFTWRGLGRLLGKVGGAVLKKLPGVIKDAVVDVLTSEPEKPETKGGERPPANKGGK